MLRDSWEEECFNPSLKGEVQTIFIRQMVARGRKRHVPVWIQLSSCLSLTSILESSAATGPGKNMEAALPTLK